MTMQKIIPEILKGHILPFNGDVRKVWGLEGDATEVRCCEFSHLLELPLWSSVPNRGLLFDISPAEVIRDPSISVYQTQRLQQTELRFPIDVLIMQEKRWILDGVHRIAKHVMLGKPTLFARFHDESIIPEIKV